MPPDPDADPDATDLRRSDGQPVTAAADPAMPAMESGDPAGQRPSSETAPDPVELFEVLLSQNAGPLMAFIRALVRNEARAEDVFQETGLVAWRRFDDFDRECPFGPWLRGIAARVALATARRHGREHAVGDAFEGLLNDRITRLEPSWTAEGAGPWSELSDCLSRLPDEMRDPIDFVYRDGRRVEDAARMVGIGVEAAKKRLQRARLRLADCLRAKGVLA